MIGIYKITNPEGKIYIGCTTNWEVRLKAYHGLRVKGQSKIHDSLIYHGIKNHKFEFIEECDVELLYEREIWWILFYNCVEDGLNIRLGGRNGSLTQDTKDKISEALKGRKNTWTKPGVGDKISKGLRKFYINNPKAGDKISKGLIKYYTNNKAKPHPKLVSPCLVEEIREKYSTGNFTRSQLFREYGVSWGTIKNITDHINSYK